jgi:hypothetical protein
MADKKISELTAITGSNTAATDVFVVVDTSTGQTKKITREELNNAIEQDVLSTVDINGGTIDGTTIGATTAAAGSFTTVDATGNITVGGTVDGRDVAADGTKLDGIEASATADQTGAQIATALNGETISSLTALTTTGAVIVGGDFTVNGTTTTINSTTLEVDDKNIVLASGAADAAAANGSGITIDGANATFTYVSTGDKWQLNKPLDVTGTVTADGLTIDGNAKVTFGSVNRYIQNPTGTELRIGADNSSGVITAYTNGSERLRIGNSGNVGIGDTAPVTPLTIATTNKLGATFTGTTNGEGLTVTQTDYTSGNYISLVEAAYDDSGDAAPNVRIGAMFDGNGSNLAFGTSNSYGSGITNTAMTIDSSGNVLVGTTTSGVASSSSNAGIQLNSSADYIAVARSGGTALYLNRQSSDGTIADFRKDGSTVGSIGVASEYLYIHGTRSTDAGLMLGSQTVAPASSTGANRDNSIDLGFAGNSFKDLYLGGFALIGSDSGDGFNADATLRLQKASGNNYVQIKTASSGQGGILIGDTDDDFVGGMIYNNSSNYLRFDSNNAEKMRLENDGDLHVDGNVVAYSTTISDIRLKKDIAPIEDAVAKVQQLNGCTFTYLKDDRKSAGLIAQDVEKVLPSAVIEDEAVFHGEEGETYKTVQYDQVIGLLVEAVKELKAEIEELKNGTAK